MKKLICLLALCLCLNSATGFAEEAPEQPPEPIPVVETLEEAVQEPVETQAPEPEREEAPEETLEAEPTEEPGETPVPEPTQAPEATEAPEATAAPEEVPSEAEAWMRIDGEVHGGDLEVLLKVAKEDAEIVLRGKKPIQIKNVAIKPLAGLKFTPDKDVFKDGKYVVNVYEAEPNENAEPVNLKDYVDAAEDETRDLWFFVEKEAEAPEATEAPEIDPEATTAPEGLRVNAVNYDPDIWQCEAPIFQLSGIPEGMPWDYAVIIYDERIIVLSEDSYIPQEEGVFTLRFAIMNEIGDILELSDKYTVSLDWTMPEVMILPDMEASYTMEVAGEDALSGLEAISLDGGRTWQSFENGDIFRYTGSKAVTFDAGMIQVRDLAGNVFQSSEVYRLEKVRRGGGGGGGGGGGEGKAAKTHASGDGEKTPEYESLELQLPDDAMDQLTIGGEPMALTLWLEGDDEAPAKFTAALASWTPEPAEDGEEAEQTLPAPRDTLVLSADMDADLGDQFTYAWRFNGEVYRLLANSGIRYVALQVGDDLVAFPTEGFTGGTKYTELKMLGVSTKKFDYTITMKVNLDPGYMSAMTPNDFSRECDVSIRAEVENMAYELSNSPQSVMYFYDVYLGPEDMLDHPFGRYVGNVE